MLSLVPYISYPVEHMKHMYTYNSPCINQAINTLFHNELTILRLALLATIFGTLVAYMGTVPTR